jgi:hypothetical protein
VPLMRLGLVVLLSIELVLIPSNKYIRTFNLQTGR